jgi:lysozyme
MPEPAEGQVPAGDYEPVPEPVPEVKTSAKTNEEVAKEVIAGHWGRGNRRKERLEAAGYNVSDVNAEITKLYNR